MKETPENIIFTQLPEETSEILISVIFQYGYFNENDNELGRAHILEHLIGNKLENKFGRENVLGTTSDRKIQFDITSTQQSANQDLDAALKLIFEQGNFDGTRLRKEKAKIQSEVYEKLVDFREWLTIQTISAAVSSPARLLRSRFGQIHNIEEVTLGDMQETHSRLTEEQHFVIIGGYKMSSSLKREFTKTALKHFQPSKIKMPSTEVVWRKKKHEKKSHPSLPKGATHFSLIFPALSLADSARDRYALGFLCEQLEDRLYSTAGEVGVYNTDYEYYVDHGHGHVSFFCFVPVSSIKDYQALFFQELEKISRNKDLEKELKSYLSRRKRNLKDRWSDNYRRMGWVIDDLLDFGSIHGYADIAAELNNITPATVKSVIKKVFNPTSAHTLTITSEHNE